MEWKGLRYHLAEEASETYIYDANMAFVAVVYTPVKEEVMKAFLQYLDPSTPFFWGNDWRDNYTRITPVTMRSYSGKHAALKVNKYFKRLKSKNPNLKVGVAGIFYDEFDKIGVRVYSY